MAKLKEPGRPSVGRRASHTKRSKNELKRAIAEAFRADFPTDTVDVSDGYQDLIHVLVVSRRFDEMSDREKQALMERILKRALRNDEVGRVSLMLPLSPADIK